MSRRISVTETATAAAATYAVTLGAHVTDDYLFVCLTQDGGTTTISLGSNVLTSVTAATDTFVYSGADVFNDGIQVEFSGTLGTSLTANTRYWVRDLNTGAKSFKVSATQGGAVFDVTGSPSGVTCHRMTGGASANNNCVGWAIIGSQAAFADSRQVWAYAIATSGSMPTPTFTGTNDDWLGTCVVIREADTTGTILWQRSDWGGTGAGISSAASNSIAASSAGGTTVITAPEDALLLYSWSSDGAAYLRCKTDELIADSKVSGNSSHIIGHRQHGASGNPANVSVYSNLLVEGGNGWVLAIPNATGGNLEKDCRSGITEVEWFGDFFAATGAIVTISNGTPAVITYTAPTTDQWLNGQGVWFSTTGGLPTGITANTTYYITGLNAGANTFNISATLGGAAINTSSAGSGVHTATPNVTAANDVITTLNSISTLSTVPAGGTASTFSAPATPWGRMTLVSNGVSTAGAWAGATRKIASTDFSGKIIALQWMVDMAPTTARAGAEGVVVAFSDGTNWAAYQLAPRALYAQSTVQQSFVMPGNSTTYATSGSVNWSAITHFVFLYHRIGSSLSTDSILIKNLFLMGTATLTGGGEDAPLDFVTLYDALNSWGSIDLASKQGSGQILGKAKVQIGDGTKTTYFDSSGASFEFPIAFATTDNVSKNWNALSDSVSINIKASASDTINLAAGGITTSVPQAVTIDATSSASATYSVAGQSFKGLSGFTDNAGIALTGPTYKECGTVSLKASMTSMSVSKTVGAVAATAMTANSKTIADSTIDLTGTSATYFMSLSSAVTALEWNNNTLTGTPASGFKFYSALTSGELTITTDGTGTAIDSGDVEFAAGTAFATVVAPTITADISITGMSNTTGANNRLQIINQTAAAAASRANSTAYSAGDVRLRQTGVGSENTAGLYLRCTTSGTSAASPPTWNTTVGGTTTDGTAVWTTYAVLYYDADPAATSLTDTYIDGEEFKAGETVEIRFAEEDPTVSFKIYSTSVIAATTGFSALANSVADSVYATYALSGAAYDTTYSPNYVASYMVLDTNTNFTGASSFAYYCYLLTTSEGMYRFWGGLTALDAGNVRNNVDVLDLFFDETAGFVRQTDDVRIFKSDGTRPALDPTTGGAGIEINWKVPVNVVTTGGSAVLPQDIIDIADAVWAKTLP